MRHLTTTWFVLLIAVLWQTGWRCEATPGVKTTPHVFPLHFVSWIDKDLAVPRIALKANFVAYPGLPVYKQFLDAPEDSPERTVARYVKVLSDGHNALTPGTLSAAKNLYAEDERKNDEAIIDDKLKAPTM